MPDFLHGTWTWPFHRFTALLIVLANTGLNALCFLQVFPDLVG
jgi:hypothetical protein